MSERHTDRIANVTALGNEKVQPFNRHHIPTEHMLPCLVKEGCRVAANALKNLDVGLHKVRLEVDKPAVWRVA